jgi:hypothetical protein
MAKAETVKAPEKPAKAKPAKRKVPSRDGLAKYAKGLNRRFC